MGTINHDLWRSIIECVIDHLCVVLPDDVKTVYHHGGIVTVVRVCCGRRDRPFGTILFTTVSVVLVDDVLRDDVCEDFVRTEVFYNNPDMFGVIDCTVLAWVAKDKFLE